VLMTWHPMARGPNDPDYEFPERSRPSPMPPPARSDPHSLMYDNFHPDAGAGVSSPQRGLSSVPRWEEERAADAAAGRVANIGVPPVTPLPFDHAPPPDRMTARQVEEAVRSQLIARTSAGSDVVGRAMRILSGAHAAGGRAARGRAAATPSRHHKPSSRLVLETTQPIPPFLTYHEQTVRSSPTGSYGNERPGEFVGCGECARVHGCTGAL